MSTASTWLTSTVDGDYNNPDNWDLGLPGANDTAFFGMSDTTKLSVTSSIQVGEWFFNPGSPDYSFTIKSGNQFAFLGQGVVANGVNVTVYNESSLIFYNNSTAGDGNNVHINNHGGMDFLDISTGGDAVINNFTSSLFFDDDSSAGSSMIHTFAGGTTYFRGFSNAGSAQLLTEAGGTVDFSISSGPAGNGEVTAGSIAGAGTYQLGGDQLTVGLDGLSTVVSGSIDDGGERGSGASLVKVGAGVLRLSGADNTYSGGTILKAGTLDLAARGAAGTGAISFAGKATLRLDTAAFTHHALHNAIDLTFQDPIDAFGRHDIIDLVALRFGAGATATYHASTHHLTVESGTVTGNLTLLSTQGLHFGTASDGHGGTDVFLLNA
jgi:autotransporter-associated beta strand protein